MYTTRNTFRYAALSLAAVFATSCADGSAGPLTGPEGASLASSSGPSALECPVSTTRRTTATIGLLGGALELDGHRVVIPANAVLTPTEFTLTVPASNYVEIDIKAAGEEHYQFRKPVSLTLSYARCTRTNIDKENLRIFYIDDSRSKALVEDMGGTDDKAARTVTTGTDHFSGYVIGQG
ncbi:MAG: hypothetical protein KY444_05280 [Gemmatimonadetes bacterium]|nr:hypothetical protein [Gemmatimonadota bacterium]